MPGLQLFVFVGLYMDLFTMVILQGHHCDNYDITQEHSKQLQWNRHRINLPIWDHVSPVNLLLYFPESSDLVTTKSWEQHQAPSARTFKGFNPKKIQPPPWERYRKHFFWFWDLNHCSVGRTLQDSALSVIFFIPNLVTLFYEHFSFLTVLLCWTNLNKISLKKRKFMRPFLL